VDVSAPLKHSRFDTNGVQDVEGEFSTDYPRYFAEASVHV